MTKAELIKELEQYPDDARVFVDDWQEQYQSAAVCNSVVYTLLLSNDDGSWNTKKQKSGEQIIVLGHENKPKEGL